MGIMSFGNHWARNQYDSKISLVSPVFVISPQLTFPQYHQSTEKHNKIARTVPPNHMGQIQLPWTSMPLMTPFHHSQFHSPILVEVGQIL